MILTPLLAFSVSIDPVAKGRPRFGNGRTYTDKKTATYERDFARLAHPHRPPTPIDGPLGLSLVFTLARGRSVKRELPAVRPDIDNYVKAVTDAMNGVFYLDDGQVVGLYATKVYGAAGSVAVQIARVA